MKEKMSKSKINLRIVIPILLVVTVVISAASVGLFTLFGQGSLSDVPTVNSSIPSDDTPPEEVEKIPLNGFSSISVTPETDFLIDDVTHEQAVDRWKAMIDSIKADGFDCIELTLNYKDGLLFETELYSAPIGDLLKEFYSYAKRQNLTVITAVDVRALAEVGLGDASDTDRICTVLSDDDIGKYSDAVLLKNCYLLPEELGVEGEPDEQQLETRLNATVKSFYSAVAKANAALSVGFEINESTMLETSFFNPKQWVDGGFADFIIVYDPYSTASDDISFMTYFEGWRTELGLTSNVYCKLAYSKVGSDEIGWEQTDQILLQLTALDTLGVSGFVIDGWYDFTNDETESRDAVKKYLANLITESYILKELDIAQPDKKTFTTSDSSVLLSGASDPEFRLTLNGEELERTELGFFSVTLELQKGLNTFVIEHKGVSETYKITYEREVITQVSPSTKTSLPGESTLLVNCTALSGSSATATIGTTTVTLTEEPILDENGDKVGDYSKYSGRITLPDSESKDVSLGKIIFKVNSSFGTETKKGGEIVVEKEEPVVIPPVSSDTTTSDTSSAASSSQDSSSVGSSSVGSSSDITSSDAGSSSSSPSDNSPSTDSSSNTSSSAGAPTGGEAWVMPSNGEYINVGNTYIAEVIANTAQTFSYGDNADYSRPTNSYLPKGTLDYCSKNPTVLNSSIRLQTLRYGKLLYATHSGMVDVNVYAGTLPDHQSINVANVGNTGRHTQITLDVLWKAPFKLELNEQAYVNSALGENRDFTLKGSATFKYVDITFCYTTLVAGEVNIPADDPVFSKAEWIKNESDYTLRLHLKKTGVFYGWSAEYNDAGQLVFSFLNPAKITADSSNDYGYRLDGITVVVDAGHGGSDAGALGSNKNYTEAVLNLTLAKMVRNELEALGATVVMTRETDVNPTSYERKQIVRDTKPDFTLSIHRNSSTSGSPRGFITYYYNAFSYNATNILYEATERAELYEPSKWSYPKSHKYFYTCRTTECPSVLTENGFMTNADEYSDMIKDDFNLECAKALTQGIVDYFVSIQ